VREGVVVAVGQNVNLPLTMGVATVQETVTVAGESPLVDAKSMGTATNFTQDELARVPNSRDPWALLRTVPGVTLDRVNIAGNETGQQAGFVSKGGRQGDAVWTMDGIPITDMATSGASPTYFDYDAFEEIQVSTGGNDIRQSTGGVGLNFVVKRGTNQIRGTARGYFTGEDLEATNIPDELAARGITGDTADHNKQISEVGIDVGGPIVKEKLFFWGSIAKQDIRLFRQSANGVDQTILKTYNAKINWQATEKDNVNFLFFNGDKVKHGRAPGYAGFEPASARFEQHNYYEDNPLHGLWKWEDNRVWSSSLFMTGKYAYYNTGFTLESQDVTGQLGISPLLDSTFGNADSNFFLRPQHTLNVDFNHFRNMGSGSHDLKFGFAWRRTDAFAQDIYPGNKIVAYENSATDFRARLYREGAGTNRSYYISTYLGDTISIQRITLDVGIRFDRQYGRALPSTTQPNDAFPNLVPGIDFSGYDPPFYWNNWSPRFGATYALDETRKTILRASFSRNAGQLSAIGGNVGYINPSSQVGYIEYPWTDRNGDHLAQANEVNTSGAILASGGGFDTANPTAVTSANQLDPDYKAPVAMGFIVGVDRELMPNFAVQVNYTYGRTTNHPYTPFIGLTSADYAPGTPLTGTLPDGSSYNIPTWIPNADKVAAVGGGRLYTNYEGYASKFSGVEFALNKRMSNKWMMRLAAAFNNATEDYEQNPPITDIGNPTRLDTNPLISGGQYAPRSGGSGSGDVFINQKWNFNLNGAYQLPWDMEVAGNLFGKQGTPFPIYRNASLGRDRSRRVLISPELDTFRFDNLWNLDLRWAKTARFGDRANLQFVMDLFNVMNSNTEINRVRNLGASNFNALTSNLSPRILRFGLRVGF
jgi:TonB-dependent Receptor Plug Domain